MKALYLNISHIDEQAYPFLMSANVVLLFTAQDRSHFEVGKLNSLQWFEQTESSLLYTVRQKERETDKREVFTRYMGMECDAINLAP